MAEPLDIDEHHEVVAAANKFRTAIVTVGGQVEQIARGFVVPRSPQSKLEIPLARCTDEMREALLSLVATNRRGADAIPEHTAQVSATLHHTDQGGASTVRGRTESA
ncbi:hypothetical protein [Nocardia pneumoniae]|uniref:hypothetical protein n=1 Tax=Nocardia pneumoniae TaxID=228601 RepID=UPI0002EF35AF|nr:hypothetical protein [Nocardia pneumoniae]